MQSIVDFDGFAPERVSAQNILSLFLLLSDYTSKATKVIIIATFPREMLCDICDIVSIIL